MPPFFEIEELNCTLPIAALFAPYAHVRGSRLQRCSHVFLYSIVVYSTLSGTPCRLCSTHATSSWGMLPYYTALGVLDAENAPSTTPGRSENVKKKGVGASRLHRSSDKIDKRYFKDYKMVRFHALPYATQFRGAGSPHQDINDVNYKYL